MDYTQLRQELLDTYAQKQSFRVSIGKSIWVNYEKFNPAYNLREILADEIVIEFDTDQNTWNAIIQTAINLYNAGYHFEIYDHKGRSPHLHIHNLNIAHLEPNKRSLFKKLFIKKYVPEEYYKFVDLSLTGVHLVRIEYSPCWKNKYGIKELVYKFNPKEFL